MQIDLLDTEVPFNQFSLSRFAWSPLKLDSGMGVVDAPRIYPDLSDMIVFALVLSIPVYKITGELPLRNLCILFS